MKDETSMFPDFRKTKNSEFYLTRPRQRATSAYLRSDHTRFSLMRSVSKGIKNVDVTDIVNFDMPRVECLHEPENLKPQNKSVTTLKEIRKLYDEALTQSNKRQKELKALQAEHKKLLEKQMEYEQITTDINKLGQKVDADLKKATEDFIYFENTVSTYEWMRERVKADKVVLAKRLYDAEQALRLRKLAKQEADDKFEQTKQMKSQAARMLSHVREEIQELEQRKRESLMVFEEKLESQKQLRDMRAKQDQQISQIADFAMRDKDASEKNWKKLLGVHTLVRVLLRDKMEREMEKFRVVEQAYQSIKMQTGVWQSEEIVLKFVNRDETYGNLLFSIAEAQKKITACKKRNEQLRHVHSKLKDHSNELDKPTKKTQIDLESEYKQIAKNSRKNTAAEIIKQRLFKFCCDELTKLDILQDRPEGNYLSRYTSENVVQLFEELSKGIRSVDTSLYDTKDIAPMEVAIENKNNIRVKIPGPEDLEEEESVVDGAEEEEMIDAVRNQILSANAWFMEEVRRKRQEQLKKKLEKAAVKEPASKTTAAKEPVE